MTVFEDYRIRRVHDKGFEVWWFSMIDIVQVLTQQVDYQTARKYWNKLKQRLGNEGSQLVTAMRVKTNDSDLRKKSFNDNRLA